MLFLMHTHMSLTVDALMWSKKLRNNWEHQKAKKLLFGMHTQTHTLCSDTSFQWQASALTEKHISDGGMAHTWSDDFYHLTWHRYWSTDICTVALRQSLHVRLALLKSLSVRKSGMQILKPTQEGIFGNSVFYSHRQTAVLNVAIWGNSIGVSTVVSWS